MENLFKKEYEISLWEDVLCWHRRKLNQINIEESNYEPGKYYSQESSSQAYGAKPYILDLDPYDAGKIYYVLATKEDNNYLEGSVSDITIQENDVNWRDEEGNLLPNTIFQFYKEQKICVIGSDTMETPIRAHSPKLVANTNGSSTLTFTIYYKYYDEDYEGLVDNPFVPYLVNERKLKLRHGALDAEDIKWYDFIIKNVQEDSESFTFTYTAKDLFINELSKSGFDIQLDTKLENNQGSILKLGREVLKDSDWQIPEDADIHLQQTKNEALYEFTLSESINAISMETKESIIISKGEKIHGFYNSVAEKLPFFQFLYHEDGPEAYMTDEERYVTNTPNYYVDGTTYNENGFPVFTVSKNPQGLDMELYVSTKFRGKRVVRQIKTEFDSVADRYVSVYSEPVEGEEPRVVYGYLEDEILSSTTVRNLVVNSNDFDSLTGWQAIGKKNQEEYDYPELELKTLPDIFSKEYIPGTLYVPYLGIKFSNIEQWLINFGLAENRSFLGGFSLGQEFVFRIKYGQVNEQATEFIPVDPTLESALKMKIKMIEYEIKEGVYNIKQTLASFDTLERDGDTDYLIGFASCQHSMSYSDITKAKLGLIIYPNSENELEKEILIEDVQLFYKEIGIDGTLVYPGDKIDTTIKEKYVYYYPPSRDMTADDIVPIYTGYSPSDKYIQQYNDDTNYEKIRSITASESNRFNLIQDLCEVFECWPLFTIDHNNLTGEILLDENYRQRKWVQFKEYVGKPNDIGFRYGINLKSIKRTIDSDNIVTKMIVKNNANEYAPDGFCSIARAQENPNKENFLLEFDYYFSQGLLDFDEVWNDLYTNANGYIGYYTKLKQINIVEDELIIEQSRLVADEPNLQSEFQLAELLLSESESLETQKRQEISEYTQMDFEDFMRNDLDTNNERDAAILEWQKDKNLKAMCAAVAKLINTSEKAESRVNVANTNLTNNLNRQKEISEILESNRVKKLALDLQFYKKYSRFLQEGSWIDENYVDDNLYYLDAESTLYTSAHPKITYDINVLELSRIPEYENYIFGLGDKTFIEDVEFFGWDYSGSIPTPRHEEIVVNEITIMLDSPEQNQIKVQNYKTQFEDLFQRITATTQAVEYSTGRYEKVTQIVQADGTIAPDTLTNSMANNSFVLSNARDQSVVWDETGITTTSLGNSSEIVRIVSGGIFLSKDGGTTWNTGITGSGINASYLTSGQLDTSKIRIMAGSQPSFRWDSTGLNAYSFNWDTEKKETSFYNSSKFVRFDQFGIYGINGNSNFNPFEKDAEGRIGEGKIWNNRSTVFALTWQGFLLNNDDGSVRITSDNDIQVFDGDKERIKIGRLGEEKYGLRISDANGAVMETNSDGTLWLKNRLNIETNLEDNSVGIGKLGAVTDEDRLHGGKVVDANGKFVVYEDGSIKASSGEIGGMTIEQLIEGGYKVEIVSDNGYVYRNGTGEKTFTFKLFKGSEQIENQAFLVQWYLDDELKGQGHSITISGSDIANGSAKLACFVELNEQDT